MYALGVVLSLVVRAVCADTHLERRATSISVNLGTTFQEMDGFGVSQAFGRANDIFNAAASAQTQALNLLFSPTSGAGLTILRNRIGNGNTASDSILPTSPGSPSATPNYQFDNNDSSQIWLSQKAIGFGVKTFYADAWGAPYFMKTNGAVGGGGSLCGVSGATCSSGNWMQAYANFLVRYVQYYKSNNITITHLGFLNEPEFAASYSSMLSSGTQAANFIAVLYPTIQAAGLGSQVKITCCDSEGWDNQKTMTAAIISAGAINQVGVITSHSYVTQPDTPISTTLHTWMTEYADLNGSWNLNWFSSGAQGEGLFWAKLIYNGIVNAGLSAYLYWEGAEASAATDSCLITMVGSTATPSARLWALAQWSRYVRPGAVRVATTSGSSALLTSAFKNTDGTVSVQVINTATTAQTVSISVAGGTFGAVQAFVSQQSNGGLPTAATASISGGVVSGSAPGSSMTTFVLSGASTTTTGTITTTTTGTTTTGSTTTTGTTTTTSTTTTSTPGTVAEFGQCGGLGWTGGTACVSPFTCHVMNAYYSQCL
ncbi:glycoside hydrolase [Mycena metata]|uniref:Glycoside hydrolase n=1 Tax=Mycena metata TaxID=1033252 RepID=A0AAD7MJ43_9AGAR|nr:glycoside hydrolase [Mycena metata]